MDTQAIDVVFFFILWVFVFSELSAALHVIKLISCRCITFLNGNSL